MDIDDLSVSSMWAPALNVSRVVPVDGIPEWDYVALVTEIEFTDEFGVWWTSLSSDEQEDVAAVVSLLEERGSRLGFPHSSAINGSRHGHMRELRVQSGGRPIRILYAFDPRRMAILLIGGDKTGRDRFYDEAVPLADQLYDLYLDELRREGLIG